MFEIASIHESGFDELARQAGFGVKTIIGISPFLVTNDVMF